MQRKHTRPLCIGRVKVGGLAPVSVQSMTNTKTDDVDATAKQIGQLAAAGCDIVRIAIPDMAAAIAVDRIKNAAAVPLIADIHFDYRLALICLERGIDGLRLNPGNMGDPAHVTQVVKAAIKRQVPIRIGVNAGSLGSTILAKYGGHATPEAMVESALQHVAILEKLDFSAIKISLKANDVPTTIKAYQLMSSAVDYPLHLGITEAGTVQSGVIKSAVGIGALLAQGIGDTIRVSLTGDPVEEVRTGNEILKALGLKEYGPTLISCPTCGRCNVDLIGMANAVEQRLKDVSKPLKVAVMGCVVNGPGEAKEADIGIAGGQGQGILFRKGQVVRTAPEAELLPALFAELEQILEEDK